LRGLSTSWRVDPEDDVLSYDVFPLCFNYRRYIDAVCAGFANELVRRPIS